ncbi:hypothetical protein PgNI_10435, partial [Pyricularia grisea]|uniref:Uncharacterized protein n=1 Tax=Pyricularia grisea TaxID=148305 RepID=A0A6P8AZS6_PYRGI
MAHLKLPQPFIGGLDGQQRAMKSSFKGYQRALKSETSEALMMTRYP